MGNPLGPFDNAPDAISAFRNARAGDHIVIKDGIYTDFDGDFGTRHGTSRDRIFIRSETPGGVTLTGKSRIHIRNSSYITITGFIFTDGFYGTGTSGAGILVAGDASRHIRITDILMDGFCSPNPPDDVRWVRVFGQYNEIDNCTFINKSSIGVTVEICRSNTEPNFAKVHHNYFGFSVPILDENGREMNGVETFRIGTSERSQYDASCIVEFNFFEECDGEIEIISNKSGNNIYRNNFFLNSNGTLALRHGNRCIVENNIFINIDKPGMGGVRITDRDHIVRNNYFYNLRQNKRSALSMEYAIPDSPLNGYYPVVNTIIENNTFVDCRMAITAGPLPTSRQTIAPTGTRARNNLIVSNTETAQIVYRSQTDPLINFSNNIIFGHNLQVLGHGNNPVTPSSVIPSGLRITDPRMTLNSDELYMPDLQFRSFGFQMRGVRVIKKEEVGASFARGGVLQ